MTLSNRSPLLSARQRFAEPEGWAEHRPPGPNFSSSGHRFGLYHEVTVEENVSSVAAGSVMVTNSGTVLGGNGSISGDVSVANGATLRGGTGSAASGTLSLSGAVTMAAGSIIELALGASGTHSTLAIIGGGTLNFAQNQAFHFIDLGTTGGIYTGIITGVANPGVIDGVNMWTITNEGWMGTFSFNGGNIDLNLAPVPEPGTWAAGILAVLALGWSVRGRVRRKLSQPAAGEAGL